jgi:hypothetical protein
MQATKVGIREFRENLSAVLETKTPVAITRLGTTIGIYLPTRPKPDFSPVLGCLDVAQALLPAALALVPTLAFDTVSRPRTGVETSLWTPDLMESRKQKA